MSGASLSINQRQYLELHDIGIGAFAPLDGVSPVKMAMITLTSLRPKRKRPRIKRKRKKLRPDPVIACIAG